MYLDITLRDLWRHKVRTALTILGITIAITAIVALGSISEGFNSRIVNALNLVTGQVIVFEKGYSFGPTMSESVIDQEVVDYIEDLEEVKQVNPILSKPIPGTMYDMIGANLEIKEAVKMTNIKYEEGGDAESGAYETIVGNYLREQGGIRYGDVITINDYDLEVVGVLEEARTFFDVTAITSLEVAREIYDAEDEVTFILVTPHDPGDSSMIAEKINDMFSEDVDATSSEEQAARAQSNVDQIRVLTLGIGIVASIVASIGVINTMVMAVFERKKEFGIMKALGAERRLIMAQVIQEGAIFGVIGGILGIALGTAATNAMNAGFGMPLAEVTPTLVITSFAYGLILSILASFYPARQAVAVDPVEAIRQ